MILAAATLLVTGQAVTEAQYTVENPDAAARYDDPVFQCYPVAAYSQLVPYQGNIISYASYYTGEPYRVYDNILTAPAFPFDEVTFWGYDTDLSNTQFEIGFYTNVGGMPGTLISSYMVTPLIEITFMYGFQRYHAVLPEKLDLPQGTLISVGADAAQGPFFWTMSNDGDNSSYQSGEGMLIRDVAFCLGSQPVVPLSNYSLLLGLALIAIFVIIRGRRA